MYNASDSKKVFDLDRLAERESFMNLILLFISSVQTLDRIYTV